jgi:UDP-glucose 4-epimerase
VALYLSEALECPLECNLVQQDASFPSTKPFEAASDHVDYSGPAHMLRTVGQAGAGGSTPGAFRVPSTVSRRRGVVGHRGVRADTATGRHTMIGVFGANGFMGKHLVRRLTDDGHAVTAVARRFDSDLDGTGVRTVAGDLRDRSAMRYALEGVETVVQLMGTSTPAQGIAQSTQDIQENVIPHVAFLRECVAVGVRRFVFVSSGGAVYGPVPADRAIPETHPTHPISSHGVTKLMMEHFIRLHSHLDDLEHVILRVANPYGPGQTVKAGQGLIPALLERHAEGRPVVIYGDGSAARDYVYVDDVVDAIARSIALPGYQQLTVNVGSGKHRTVLDVVTELEAAAGVTFDVEKRPARATDVDRIALDVSLARRVLEWIPRIEFTDGLKRTVQAMYSAARM